MRAQLEAVVEELKTLRAEGVEGIYLGDETLSRLRAVAKAGPTEDKPRPVTATKSIEHEPQPNLLADWKSESTQAKSAPKPIAKADKPVPKAKGVQGLPPGVEPPPAPTPFTLPEGDKQARWEWLREKVLKDSVCQKHAQLDRGNKVVLGVGNLDADIFFCGEAPGADEALQGEPFVGNAGQLLTKIIAAMGLKREQVYIGNIMNWRPEHDKPYGNRKPEPVEMAYCLPYLQAQVEIVQPKVIVALGGTAADGLLGPDPDRTVSKARGRWLEYSGTPLVVTYHPSYLLHNASDKSKRLVWEDMLLVMEKIGLPISEKQRGYFLPKA